MRSRLLLWLLGMVLAAVAGAEDIAIVGATVHTLKGADPVEDAVILIADGQISAVGTGLTIPVGYRQQDARGKIITPGLIESYSQLSVVEIGGEAATRDARVQDYPAGAAFDVRYALNDTATALAVNRRDGVTRAIVAPAAGNDPFAGWGVAIRLGGDLLSNVNVGLFGGLGADVAEFAGGSRSAVVQRLRRGLETASRYDESRYQPGPGDHSHQDLAALQQFLRDRDVPLVLEAHRAEEIRQALALAAEFKLKLVVRGGTEAWKVRDLLAAQEVPVIVEVLANLPVSFERLGARLDNAALLHEAGVTLLLSGGETQNARWLRQMAGNAVAHGLPWEAALAAMTRAPGEVWRLQKGLGTLTPGAPADLVIWSADPLELTSWAERVMIDGAWQDMNSRQTRLFERYRDLSAEEFYYRTGAGSADTP